MNAITFGDFTDFNGVAISLQDRTTFSKFDRLINGTGFDNNIPAYGLFYFAKRSVGNNVVVSHNAGIIKRKAVASDEFVLRSNSIDPVPRLDAEGKKSRSQARQ